jgi:hypothetical protein
LTAPELSVILVTPDSYDRIRKTMRWLLRQTVQDRLEVVIVAPTLTGLGPSDAEWSSFSRIRTVAAGTFLGTGHARAAGVRQATAPVVAFAEDHCFPDPGWAEELIRMHREPWGAVAPALANANPGWLSWADFLLNFGPAVLATRSGAASRTPWHNTSYKRDLLEDYGARLECMLEVEGRLQEDLVRRGRPLYLDAGIRAHHTNMSRLRSYTCGQFWGGRLYAAARVESGGWRRLRRLVYALGSPLIPLMRMPRVLRDARRAGRLTPLLPPACLLGLVCIAAGEMAGYAAGAGAAGKRRLSYEFHRRDHVRARDIPVLESD